MCPTEFDGEIACRMRWQHRIVQGVDEPPNVPAASTLKLMFCLLAFLEACRSGLSVMVARSYAG
jgi:hypothetical protein